MNGVRIGDVVSGVRIDDGVTRVDVLARAVEAFRANPEPTLRTMRSYANELLSEFGMRPTDQGELDWNLTGT